MPVTKKYTKEGAFCAKIVYGYEIDFTLLIMQKCGIIMHMNRA